MFSNLSPNLLIEKAKLKLLHLKCYLLPSSGLWNCKQTTVRKGLNGKPGCSSVKCIGHLHCQFEYEFKHSSLGIKHSYLLYENRKTQVGWSQWPTLLSLVTSTMSTPVWMSRSDINSFRAWADCSVHSGHWQLSLSQVKGYRLWPPSSHSTSTSLSSPRARTCLIEWPATGREADPSVCCPRSCTKVRRAGSGLAACPGLRQAFRARQVMAEVLLCRAGRAKRENVLNHIFEWFPPGNCLQIRKGHQLCN